MNINPELYDQTNLLQQRDGEVLLKRVQRDFGGRPIECVVDIGCGTGNITNLIENYVNCDQIVAFDLSPEMIDYAEKTYKKETVSFKSGDICEDPEKLLKMLELPEEGAEVVLSIYCLHWITGEKQKKAMSNIVEMMKPGGKCYLLFFSWSDMLPLQEQMTLHPKWREYFKEVPIPEETLRVEGQGQGSSEVRRRRSSAPFPTFESPPEDERFQVWRDLCGHFGLEVVDISLQKTDFDFKTKINFRNMLKSLCHFLPYIPIELRNDFLDDYYDHVGNTYIAKNSGPDPSECSTLLSYEYITVIAIKPTGRD